MSEMAQSFDGPASENVLLERNGPADVSSACKHLQGTKPRPGAHDASPVSKSTGTFQTPVRSCYKRLAPLPVQYGFASLPVYGTSPSQPGPFEASNPFDDGLTQRLHLPFCSPSVFARVVSPSQAEHQFCWTIEDVANLQPAPIEEVSAEQAQLDPELELRAQEAISRYFRSHRIVPSPWSAGNSAHRADMGAMTDSPKSAAGTTIHLAKGKYLDEGGPAAEKVSMPTQTVLSFPPVLPPALEEALKPYFICPTEAAEPRPGDDELSSSSVRRKRLFSEGMSVSPATSPLRGSSTMPAFKERLYPSTPITQVRTFEVIREISPPQLSPISKETNLQCNAKSMTRLEFSTNMSIDDIDHAKDSRDGADKENAKPAVSSERLGDTGYNTASICVSDVTASGKHA
ncbi:protein aurora borealis isoform X2 [Bacillus rossius redtenbacheri]|uniref:protein aurora borealis isoform X2 n=1 Tax=Bacillus rossius redtenbacheri TaxID=93214 RepID=UPI002FDE2B6E